jgi:hypothetical protein
MNKIKYRFLISGKDYETQCNRCEGFNLFLSALPGWMINGQSELLYKDMNEYIISPDSFIDYVQSLSKEEKTSYENIDMLIYQALRLKNNRYCAGLLLKVPNEWKAYFDLFATINNLRKNLPYNIKLN